jgi:4-hydroxybenzoate polyprenyltransferase
MSTVAAPELPEIRSGSSAIVHAALVAARPQQWSKNLLLLAGILFAAKLGDFHRWIEAAIGLTAYCAASSAAYLGNDVKDATSDRLHPTKRLRPVASGQLAPRAAMSLAATLGTFAVVLSALLGPASAAFMLGFLCLQVAYSQRLKRIAVVDVATIAALFVVRAAAGATAVSVRISPWLLACTALLALFLGFAKRRAELELVRRDETPGRTVLGGYSRAGLDRLVAGVAAAAVLAYSLYAVFGRGSSAMVLTIPFVAFGVARYLVLIHRDGVGEEPENVLLADRQIQLTVLAWALSAALVLAVG